MVLADAIAERRSIRRYLDQPISDALLETLLRAAGWAPSAHNRQPWRFALLRAAAPKDRLARAMGARLTADRRRDGDAEAAIAQDVARSHARITGAPVVIAVCLSLVDMDRYHDEARAAAERLMAVQSTAMAVQNLLLAATAQGLGACWMCAPLFCPEVVRAALDLPGDWEPQALVTLGHPASAGKAVSRRPIAETMIEIS
jgi:F420 biosynthesis protein FbiB-like protein